MREKEKKSSFVPLFLPLLFTFITGLKICMTFLYKVTNINKHEYFTQKSFFFFRNLFIIFFFIQTLTQYLNLWFLTQQSNNFFFVINFHELQLFCHIWFTSENTDLQWQFVRNQIETLNDWQHKIQMHTFLLGNFPWASIWKLHELELWIRNHTSFTLHSIEVNIFSSKVSLYLRTTQSLNL